MRYGILGPLEVHHDGRRLDVGGPQQRALLAALLINANRVVSIDRLIAYLWADCPPAAARSLVQGCVAQLRRVCRAADPSWRRLLTRAPGYLLEVTRGELDLDRFEALVAEASDADPAKAADVLAEALALWRGPALDGVAVEAARADAARLEEQRLAVVEQRLEAQLRLGRYPSLIVELESQVRAYPLRERLWAMLMLAQYGDDRQADALATYQRLRQTMVDELGIEPSPSLRRLQATILAGGDALASHRAPAESARPEPPRAAGPVPAQLPPTVAGFTGRAEHLGALDELLSGQREATAVGVVSGSAGVGKTALAVHWGQRVARRFPDGQLYVNLQGYGPVRPTRPIDALAGFLQSLGVATEHVPLEPDRATAQYRSLVAGRRMLVVLDNARSADQVRPLLPGGSGCLVLVTSRDRLGGLIARDGARPVALQALPPADAVTLIARVLGLARTAAEAQATAELARLCGHLPLALRIAAANLACQPGRRIADEVAALSAGDRLNALEIDGDRQSAVRAAFDQSYFTLSPAERLLFRRLGLVPGPDFSTEAAAALCADAAARTHSNAITVAPTNDAITAPPTSNAMATAHSNTVTMAPTSDADTTAHSDAVAVGPGGDGVEGALERLTRANLIQPVGPGRYALHDLLRLYAAEQAVRDDDSGALRAATDRLYEWYQSGCEAAARALYPGKLRLRRPDPGTAFAGPVAAAAWLDVERANLVAATLQAAGQGPHPAAWILADALRGYLWLRMYLVDWEPVAAAGLAAATAAGDLAGQAACHLSSADLNRCQGRYADAIRHYTEGATLAERAGWPEGQMAALGNLGTAYFWRGDLAIAAEHYQRGLDLARASGRPAAQAVRLGNLGLVYWLLGRFAEAADHQAQALALHRQLGARGNEGIDLANLGECQHALGELAVARAHLTAALAIHHEVGDRGAEAETRAVLAAVERDAGRLEVALDLAGAAVDLARSTGDRPITANALTVLASVHDGLGETATAAILYGEALESARATGTRHAELAALVGLALTTRAGDHAEEAIARAGDFRVLRAHAHAALATLAPDVEAARRHAREAFDIYRSSGYRLGIDRMAALLGQSPSTSAS